MLRIDFDPGKAASNLAKHGVSFAEATTVFDDLLAADIVDERHSGEELRRIMVGMSRQQRLLYVVYTEFEPLADHSRVVRLIGARTATAMERRVYEEDRA